MLIPLIVLQCWWKKGLSPKEDPARGSTYLCGGTRYHAQSATLKGAALAHRRCWEKERDILRRRMHDVVRKAVLSVSSTESLETAGG
jgi:hypothetical protein